MTDSTIIYTHTDEAPALATYSFLPVISANTQARHEGYFRLEWNLVDLWILVEQRWPLDARLVAERQ